MKAITTVVGLWITLARPPQRDERGLSQSTENAILLAGAVAVAILIITVITQFVGDNLPPNE